MGPITADAGAYRLYAECSREYDQLNVDQVDADHHDHPEQSPEHDV